mgnify:CR=1 FL=1
MPDRTLRVVTYAAGASLAAIALIYVFGPTYFLDTSTSKSSTRRKGVVGLSNPANDCFINSVLQALAGLGELRLYLIQETHRRSLDDESIYTRLIPPSSTDEENNVVLRFPKDTPDWKLVGLQTGIVTKSLKGILDALNERPIDKKTISAAPFVRDLEDAFRQRISRQQQDAQEFLQIVAERLCDEYYAARRARWLAKRSATLLANLSALGSIPAGTGDVNGTLLAVTGDRLTISNPSPKAEPILGDGHHGTNRGSQQEFVEEDEDGFPLEGRLESQIECLTCRFKPRPTVSAFCTLTLNVPQVSTTTLGDCFDGLLKTEYIDDFRCEKCRLLHALAFYEREAQRASSEAARARTQEVIKKLQLAIESDPEQLPQDVVLPDIRQAPKKRIARYTRITKFPRILAIHLSRSIYDASHMSLKNMAKVTFPESLPLGSLLEQRRYKLLSVVTHKGSHNSGHYESFRRQNIYPPFSNSCTFQASSAFGRASSPASTVRTHSGRADSNGIRSMYSKECSSAVTLQSPSSIPSSPIPRRPAESKDWASVNGQESAVSREHLMTPSSRHIEVGTTSSTPPITELPTPASKPKAKHHKQPSRWWRISDDKVKEATTREVLSMQREVYLLFYEREKPLM